MSILVYQLLPTAMERLSTKTLFDGLLSDFGAELAEHRSDLSLKLDSKLARLGNLDAQIKESLGAQIQESVIQMKESLGTQIQESVAPLSAKIQESLGLSAQIQAQNNRMYELMQRFMEENNTLRQQIASLSTQTASMRGKIGELNQLLELNKKKHDQKLLFDFGKELAGRIEIEMATGRSPKDIVLASVNRLQQQQPPLLQQQQQPPLLQPQQQPPLLQQQQQPPLLQQQQQQPPLLQQQLLQQQPVQLLQPLLQQQPVQLLQPQQQPLGQQSSVVLPPLPLPTAPDNQQPPGQQSSVVLPPLPLPTAPDYQQPVYSNNDNSQVPPLSFDLD
ncbi:MAG: hypothetical protein E6Q06_04130, partial [Candidatus Moraniibacteriota bacterium]